MKAALHVLALLAALASLPAHAQDAASAPVADAPPAVTVSTTPADKATCLQSAGDQKGAQLATHMKTCLAAKKDEKAAKAKVCAGQGADKTGPAFRSFMKECMAKPAA